MNNYSLVDYVNQAPGMIAIKDKNSKIEACSPLLARLCGFDSPDNLQGLTDYDMRCDAVLGAEQFILQDREALKHGEHLSIDIYTYSDGERAIIYSEKKCLIQKDQPTGLYCVGQSLMQLEAIRNNFLTLLKLDGKFLTIETNQPVTYALQDSYVKENLTKAESVCLFYVLRGKSNKEIARQLNLSYRTIDGRVESIKQKLGCSSKYQLIDYAQQEGLLTVIIKSLLSENNVSLWLGKSM